MESLRNLSFRNKIFLFTSTIIVFLCLGVALIASSFPASEGRWFLVMVCSITLLSVVLAYWVSRMITRPMSKLTKVSDEISRGNLDLDPGIGTEVRCWDIKKCNETDCPAYEMTDRPCWYVDQTLGCGGGLSGLFPEKVEACHGCDVYQKHAGDELVQLANAIRNMTIRLKSSEAGLIESEKKYRMLFDSGPNPTFVIDQETLEILEANPSAEDTYGYSKEELIGRPFTDLGPIKFDTVGLSAPKRSRVVEGHTFSQKVRHYKKGKRPFYVNVHFSPTMYGERKALKVVTMDITEMVEKDAQLIQAGKMTSLGEMSAGIAHELNQPLNAIRIGNDFLKKMIEEERQIPEKDLYEVINETRRQVDRAAEIINRLREFGRKTEFAKETLNINKPVKGVLDILGRQLRLQNIDVKLELDENLPPILAHNNRLEQVIFNLVTNARDAILMKSGQGQESDRRITIRSFKEGDRAAMTVSDTGIGISEEVKEKIFEPFFTTKEAGKGLGLGLSISYGIVRDYGGEIHVNGNQGEGTTFKITFPLAPQ